MSFKLTPVDKPVRGRKRVWSNEDYFVKYGDVIRGWADENFVGLVEGRASYSWNGLSAEESVTERNRISSAIVSSRKKNGGSVDLGTLDMVMDWGGLRRFPLDEDEALRVTGEGFSLLDSGDLKGATLKLLSVYDVGIASASKVIGLSNQNRFAIYDSRVGTALRSLKADGRRLIKCPTGRSRPGDTCSNKVWAENYERLIWVLEIISGYMCERGYPFSVSDVEMALFMLGK